MLINEKGMTLAEVLISVAIASLVMVGLNGLVGGVYEQWQYGSSRQELLSQGNFAMSRIVQAVNATRRVLIPLNENDVTAHFEAQRDLLAVTLDPGLNRDNNTLPLPAPPDTPWFDADNDGDGLIDEDIPSDNTNDGAPGIIGIDDDNDTFTDENNGNGDWISDNDEDGDSMDDWIDGKNNDEDVGDGSIDEDISDKNFVDGGDDNNNVDNDGDGLDNEDWLDVVVFFISPDTTQLIERIPNIDPIDGTDYTEHVIAQADSINFSVERITAAAGERADLIEIILVLTDEAGGDVQLQTSLRVGGGK